MFSSYDLAALNDYHKQLEEPSTFWLFNPSIDLAAGELVPNPEGKALANALFDGLGRGYKRISRGYRFDIALWRWVLPREPLLKSSQLKALQVNVGLESLDYKAFLSELKSRCNKLNQDHGKLGYWLRRRIALLEHELNNVPSLPSELSELQTSLLLQLVTVMLPVNTAPDYTAHVFGKFIQKCLDAAAMAALSAFSESYNELYCNANLMLPVRLPVENQTLTSAPAFQHAEGLWDDADDGDRVLMVVYETRNETEHIGFWTPLSHRGQNNCRLPGAPTAYYEMKGSAVFKDDPPLLSGFSDQLRTRWNNYMTNEFQEDMFISLPLISPVDKTKKPIAVLNINVNIAGDLRLYRAYHEQWLQVARDRATPFINLAVLGCLIGNYANDSIGGPIIPIDTEVREWNHLPGADVLAMLETMASTRSVEYGQKDLPEKDLPAIEYRQKDPPAIEDRASKASGASDGE